MTAVGKKVSNKKGNDLELDSHKSLVRVVLSLTDRTDR